MLSTGLPTQVANQLNSDLNERVMHQHTVLQQHIPQIAMPQQNLHQQLIPQNVMPPQYVHQQHIPQKFMLQHTMPQAPIPQQRALQQIMAQHTIPQQLLNTGQQAIYPQQPHQFTSIPIPHMPSYMNAPAVCCYNIHGPATNCVSSYQVPPGQHFSGYGSSTQPPIQAQPHFYHNAAMMHYPPQQVPPATQNTVQTVPTANNPQPLPQHGSHNTRLPSTIPMIDLSTGRDRLNKMYEEQQSKDEVSVVEEFDHPPNHELVQVYQLPTQAVQLRIYVVQANKLQPATKEEEPGSLANEVTPVTSSITDIVETAITNKASEDGESHQKVPCYFHRQQEKDSHDTKEQFQDALSLKKDSLISGNFNNEKIKQKDLMVNLLTNKDIAENSQCDGSIKSTRKDKIEAKILASLVLNEEDVTHTTSVMQSSIPDLGHQSAALNNNTAISKAKVTQSKIVIGVANKPRRNRRKNVATANATTSLKITKEVDKHNFAIAAAALNNNTAISKAKVTQSKIVIGVANKPRRNRRKNVATANATTSLKITKEVDKHNFAIAAAALNNNTAISKAKVTKSKIIIGVAIKPKSRRTRKKKAVAANATTLPKITKKVDKLNFAASAAVLHNNTAISKAKVTKSKIIIGVAIKPKSGRSRRSRKKKAVATKMTPLPKITKKVDKPNFAATAAVLHNSTSTNKAKVTKSNANKPKIIRTRKKQGVGANATTIPAIAKAYTPNLPYSNTNHLSAQWNVLKVYTREVLLAMRKYPANLKKPNNLPEDILKKEYGLGDIIRFNMGNNSMVFPPNFGNDSFPNQLSLQHDPSSSETISSQEFFSIWSMGSKTNDEAGSTVPSSVSCETVHDSREHLSSMQSTGAESVSSQQEGIPELSLSKTVSANVGFENVLLDATHYENTLKKAREYIILRSVLNRSKNERLKRGKLYSILIGNGTVQRKDFCERLKSVVSEAKNLMIDLRTFWKFLAEFVSPLVYDKRITWDDLSALLDEYSKNIFGFKFLAVICLTIITENKDEKDHAIIGSLLRDSNTKLSNFMPDSHINNFIELINKFRISVDLLKRLSKMFADNTTTFEDITDWISKNVGDAVQENQFIRTLATAIFEFSIVNEKLKADILAEKYCYFLRYVDSNPNLELQCLFALQSVINKLEHPQGILLDICNRLYEDTIFSRESFLAWETNGDPLEQEGKGVTLKQLMAFFVGLKHIEYELASEDV